MNKFLIKNKKMFNYKKLYDSYDIIKNGIPSIYFLYKKNELIYIGKSITLFSRLCGHLHNNKKFDKIKIFELKNISDMHIIEPYLIIKFNPKLNKEFNSSIKPSFNLNYRKSIINEYLLE